MSPEPSLCDVGRSELAPLIASDENEHVSERRAVPKQYAPCWAMRHSSITLNQGSDEASDREIEDESQRPEKYTVIVTPCEEVEIG